MDIWRGQDLIFLGGGIAMPPIRCVVWYALEESLRLWRDHGRLWSPDCTCLVYVDELDQWADFDRVRVIPSVDPEGQMPDWKGKIGFG